MHPELVNLGFLHLKTYGVCIAVGFLLAWKIIEKLSGREDLSNLLVSLMVAGIIGGRAAYVIENWSREFSANPLSVIRIDQGGLVFYGGLILSIIVFFAYCIMKKERPAALADLLASVVPLAHAFGRIGCFFFGCCYGKESRSAFAVCFPMHSPAWYEQVVAGKIPPVASCSLPVMPAQLFEAGSLLILFAVTCTLYRVLYRRGAAEARSGIVSGVYLMGYAVVRFFLEYLRGDPRAQVGPFSIAQTISFGILLLGIAFATAGLVRPGKSNGRVGG